MITLAGNGEVATTDEKKVMDATWVPAKGKWGLVCPQPWLEMLSKSHQLHSKLCENTKNYKYAYPGSNKVV